MQCGDPIPVKNWKKTGGVIMKLLLKLTRVLGDTGTQWGLGWFQLRWPGNYWQLPSSRESVIQGG